MSSRGRSAASLSRWMRPMTPDPRAMLTPRRDRVRILGALVAVLSMGMAAMLFYISHVSAVADQRYERQQQTITQLVIAVKAAQQDASAQRRLVRALQRQVRQLGGVPLTEPPPARSRRGNGAESTGSAPTPTLTPAASRSPAPQSSPKPSSSPSPRPSHSPSPSPSPAASVCIRGVGCVSIGGLLALLASW